MKTSVTFDLIRTEAARVELLKAHYLRAHGWLWRDRDGGFWEREFIGGIDEIPADLLQVGTAEAVEATARWLEGKA